MPSGLAMTTQRTRATAAPEPNELELCCPLCGGFIAAIEKPTHRLEQNVSFRIRLYCKRCPHKFRTRVTFEEEPAPTKQAHA